MFHFPGCPLLRLWIHLRVTRHYPGRVPPFGNSWINAYLRLPTTYRSLSRPSSAISAMASTLRSCSLDLASSRQLLLPKTLESSNQQKIVCCLFLPCAVFKVRSIKPKGFWICEVSIFIDPSKRYRNQSFCCQTPLTCWPTLSTPCVVVAAP